MHSVVAVKGYSLAPDFIPVMRGMTASKPPVNGADTQKESMRMMTRLSPRRCRCKVRLGVERFMGSVLTQVACSWKNNSFYVMSIIFCPWCGKRLPSRKARG